MADEKVATSLLIWSDSRPTDAEMTALKVAKAGAGVDFKVLPRRAFPGCGGRVLAVGTKPHWLADYAYIESYHDPRLMKALRWVLLGDEVLGEIPGPRRILDQLKDVFGPGVKEITIPDDEVW